MYRKEFMEELENMLQNIQESEREEALQYYNDYFDEAGEENEEKVIRELGTPAKVAAIIKTSLQESEHESGEFTERGYSDPRFTINYEVVDTKETSDENTYEHNNKTYNRERTYAKETSGGKIALYVIIGILALPVILPLAGSLLGLILAIIGVAIGAFVAIAASAIACCVGGIAVFVVGIVTLFTQPVVGIFSCGIGLLLLGLGILLVVLTAQICFRLIPWLIRSVVSLCRMPLSKRGII